MLTEFTRRYKLVDTKVPQRKGAPVVKGVAEQDAVHCTYSDGVFSCEKVDPKAAPQDHVEGTSETPEDQQSPSKVIRIGGLDISDSPDRRKVNSSASST